MLHTVQSFPSSADPTLTELTALAAAQLELTHWRARLRFDDLESIDVYPRDAQRSYVRLPSRAGCEAWLIVWPPGSRAPLHDHGLASALASVLCGELSEALQHGTDPFIQRTWRAGATVEIVQGARHEVWNPGERTAYSLHVYTPRLASMTYYERTEAGGLQVLHTERAENW
jgi:predicted metal-dependent enzyme (double-stranded beta helix superfamily)